MQFPHVPQVSYYDQMTACENKQEKLEQIACEVHERSDVLQPGRVGDAAKHGPTGYEEWSVDDLSIRSHPLSHHGNGVFLGHHADF